MAYVSIESDDRMEEGPEGLQFQSFGTEQSGNAGTNTKGYRTDGVPRRNSFWNADYYQEYFDVDTVTVIRRCYMTLYPPRASSYISTHLLPAPDLYGPFWTLTTLIAALFVCSSLASSIAAYLSDPTEDAIVEYDFGLLSIAVALVYSYGLGVPVLTWLALRYLGVGEWSIIEAIAIWGYGQFVWIPVSLLCVIPVPLVRWILVGIAFGMSGWFLVANVYPVLATADNKAVRMIVVVLAVLHAGLALSLKVLFFSYYAVKQIGVGDPVAAPLTSP